MTLSWYAFLLGPVVLCLAALCLIGLYYAWRARRRDRRILRVYRCAVCGKVYEAGPGGTPRCPQGCDGARTPAGGGDAR